MVERRLHFRRALALGMILTCSQIPTVLAYPRLSYALVQSASVLHAGDSSLRPLHPRANGTSEVDNSIPSSVIAQDIEDNIDLAIEGSNGQVEVPVSITSNLLSTSRTTSLVQYTEAVSKSSQKPSTKKSSSASKTSSRKSSTSSHTTSTNSSKSSSLAKSTKVSTTSKTTSSSTAKKAATSGHPSSQTSSSARGQSTTSKSSTIKQTTSTSSSVRSVSSSIASSSLPTRTITSTRTSTSTVTRLTSLSPSAVQTAATTRTAQTSGSAISNLETAGEVTSQPFATSVAIATTQVSLINTASTSLPSAATQQTTQTAITATNVFVAIATDAPPAQISQRADHPVPRTGIQSQSQKLETNKFYANFFLGSQASSTWTHPYSVAWSKGTGGLSSWGLSISHIERGQLAFGPGSNGTEYFINPLSIQSMILSASELGNSTNITLDTLEAFSVNVNLLPSTTAQPVITFPLVQGMGFVTGIYNDATPLVQSGVSIIALKYEGLVASNKTYKYLATLNDATQWLMYVTPNSTIYPGNTFTLTSANAISGTKGFSGTIQIAKIPSSTTDAEAVYDSAAGTYATTASISGSVEGVTGSYSLSWNKGGNTNQKLLMWALPHHNETLSDRSGVTDLSLVTTTKGYATAILADSWTLLENNLPIDMGFSPWSPATGSIDSVSATAAELINAVGTYELSEDITSQTDLNSQYYSGKGLAKFAAIVVALHDIVGNKTLAYTGLQKLEAAFATFVNNSQVVPLVYDSAWGGAVSSSTYEDGNSGDDFGNTYYNDHHFHYGYFCYAAAVIGYLDPAWLDQGTNKAWVNMLVRDYANPVSTDPYFPMSRSFDFYHGHSWAKGLFESGDGKDQESSSEDSNAAYAIKMWGRTINDTAMEARGNLMLAIQARSLQHYFLYQTNNTVEPPQTVQNRVSGVLFENKIDHTTYFGANIEYIEGIHMLPLLPFSTLTRTKDFVTEEWNQYFANYAANVTGGWKGILYANLAIIDPVTSYSFFSNSTFDYSFLDGGASRTWYLTWSAALGGSPA